MDTKPVESSHIHSVGYDQKDQTLAIRFHKGGTYHYEDVPPEIHKALMNSPSHGQHFLRNIKDNYRGTKQ